MKNISYSIQEFKKYLDQAINAHDNIIDLYNNELYETGWTDEDINKFENNLQQYTEAVEILKKWLPLVKWNDPNNKKKFEKLFWEYTAADEKSFRLVKIRHDAYKTYRGFRQVLVSRLNHVMGWAKSSDDEQVFEYFNMECNNVPLYNNKNEKGEITVNQEPCLANWYKGRTLTITRDINKTLRLQPVYDETDIFDIFKYYVKAREGVFAIFNMLTSTSEVNGYDKWHNFLEGYITNDTRVVNDKNLKTMYMNTQVDQAFIPKDDYQQIMDDRTWNARGIYESWMDDLIIDDYNRKARERRKSENNITKINMIGKDANACRVTTDGSHVYAATKFYPGDIVEIVPTRALDKSSLYAKDVREMAFEVVPNEEWVIPFGYCQYYDLESESEAPNCDFIWDPIKRVIVIKAINKIGKYEKLILNNVK